MTSRNYQINLSHFRHFPIKYSFHYKVFFFSLNLDELPQLHKKLFFFSYNKFNLFSIYDKHYLEKGAEPIKKKIEQYLDVNSKFKISKIELITVPRYFGYAFNPVSFYICYHNNSIECVLSEVENTYKERHLYVLKKTKTIPSKKGFFINTKKQLFVSPFNTVSGDYSFKVIIDDKSLDIAINLNNKKGQRIISTKMIGNSQPLTNKQLIKTFISFPFSALLTLTRISYHGILLKSKSLKTYLKPKPHNSYTIRHAKIPLHRRFYFYLLEINRFFKFPK